MTRPVTINGAWTIQLVDSCADEWEGNMAHHAGAWEGPRLVTLQQQIETFKWNGKPNPLVLYVGAYKGDMPALLGTWGAQQILVEASPGFWSVIRENWEANELTPPIGCFSGLISTRSTYDGPLVGWPERSASFVEGTTGFSHLAESAGHFPEITIDDLCGRLNVVPDIITMDIEGSELEALKGASDILAQSPTLVLSVHPEFMFHNHGTYERELHDLLLHQGYKGRWLDYDHEHHWLYTK